jgi:hypothetical protein
MQWKCEEQGCECAEFVDKKSFENAVFEGLENEIKGRKKELERFIKNSIANPHVHQYATMYPSMRLKCVDCGCYLDEINTN